MKVKINKAALGNRAKSLMGVGLGVGACKGIDFTVSKVFPATTTPTDGKPAEPRAEWVAPAANGVKVIGGFFAPLLAGNHPVATGAGDAMMAIGMDKLVDHFIPSLAISGMDNESALSDGGSQDAWVTDEEIEAQKMLNGTDDSSATV